jgi:hypothetical protein
LNWRRNLEHLIIKANLIKNWLFFFYKIE